jgi:hypothetical protein
MLSGEGEPLLDGFAVTGTSLLYCDEGEWNETGTGTPPPISLPTREKQGSFSFSAPKIRLPRPIMTAISRGCTQSSGLRSMEDIFPARRPSRERAGNRNGLARTALRAHATERMASARAKINTLMVKAVSIALASERVAREERERSSLVDHV